MATPLTFQFDRIQVRIKYSNGVLSPSPFSRLLATALSERIPSIRGSINRGVLDVGCGSGIQAIVLALCGLKQVYAVDIDSRCVAATEFNSLLNGVSEWAESKCKVSTYLGDMLEPLEDRKMDLIVSNPPSLPQSDHTPTFATGGKHPYEFLDRLIRTSALTLSPRGRLIMVISSLVGLERTRSVLRQHGFRSRILKKRTEKFRDFYYPHMSYYKRSQLDGVATFKELPNGELAETLYVLECSLEPQNATTNGPTKS